MSGVFGVLQTDHNPIDRDALLAMNTAMAYWGDSGGGVWVNNNIAMGAHLFRVTPEDAFEQQPLKLQHLTLVAHARVDNRDELRRKLGLGPISNDCDSSIILQLYLKYGQDCFDMIVGDWSVGLWDDLTQKLTLALSATGNVSMCWAKINTTFIFSNGLQGILAHPLLSPQPNPYYLAGMLTAFNDPAHANETAYEGVFRLAAGHFLTIDRNALSIKQWWAPQRLAPIFFNNPQDYYDAFLEIYSEAVKQRIRTADGGVATTLSSGFDSSSVAALAAPMLAARGERLRAYVHTPLFEPSWVPPGKIANEWPLATLTANYIGNIDAIACNSQGWSVLDNIKLGLEIHGQPNGSASNNYWMHNIFQTARNANVKILLNGQGGNATVSYTGKGSLLPALRSAEFGLLKNELCGEAAGLFLAVKRRILKPLLVPAMGYFGRFFAVPDAYHWKSLSAINNACASEIGLPERMRACGHSGSLLGAKLNAEQFNLWRLTTPRGPESAGSRWMQLGAYFGLAMNDPTTDKRIVEFCWQVPDRIFWAHGTQRALIRQGMKHKLPKEILATTSRGLQSADLALRLKTELNELDACLQQFEGNALTRHWLALDRMKSALHTLRSQQNPRVHIGSLSALLKGIGVGLFLQKF